MAKNLTEGVLLDFYGELLTEKQQNALELYYNQDLSLAEIAEEMQVSRQGVRAFIKQGESHLKEFEEKLNMAERFAQISRLTADIKEMIAKSEQKKELDQISKKIEEIESRL